MEYTTKQLENMCKMIESFPKEEHIKILEIIKSKITNISENNNGCFIHMEELSNDTLNEINHYIEYVNKKENEITCIENEKELMKNNINNNSEQIL